MPRPIIRTTDLNAVIASAPINRQAAIAGAGTNAPEADGPLQRRENLVRFIRQLERAIAATSDPARKRALGLQKHRVQTAINELRSPDDVPHGDRDLPHFILDVLKERLTTAEWRLATEEARRRWNAARAENEQAAA